MLNKGIFFCKCGMRVNTQVRKGINSNLDNYYKEMKKRLNGYIVFIF